MTAPIGLFLLAFLTVAPTVSAGMAPQTECSDWRACRELALAAADRRDYSAFHDLAWRAVQTGPRNDSSLLYLLARAQALSGRLHDALVMIERIAPNPLASEALTDKAFEEVRQLPAWVDVETRLKGGTTTPSATSSTAAISASPAGTSTAAAPAMAPATATEAGHFLLNRFQIAGLAYDAVSQRFVLGDQSNRKVVIVGKGTDHGVDLVRADSAGFQSITALTINSTRGDLWVASGDGGTASLHRLQLVSGRPLRSYPVNLPAGPVSIVDLAVTGDDAILALDGTGGQLVQLRAGNTNFEPPLRIDAPALTSLTVADDRYAYVSHHDGLLRIDLQTRRTARVPLPANSSIGRIEQIRFFRDALIAVTAGDDGRRRLKKLELNAAGTAVRRVLTIDVPLSADRPLLAVSSNDLLYLVPASTVSGASSAAADTSEFVAYTLTLK
jgi:hypothetical protein